MSTRTMYWIAVVLTVIGALNWGLVGLFQYDLVAAIFGGSASIPSRIIYVVVALAGLGLLALSFSPNVQIRETTETGRMTPTG